MNKQIVIICVGSPTDAQILAQQIAKGEFDITVSTGIQKPEFKSDRQSTTEIVDAALPQSIEKSNKAEKTDSSVKQDSTAYVARLQERNAELQERNAELQERQCLDTYYSIPDIAFMAVLMKTGENASKVAIVNEYKSNKVYYNGIVSATYAQR